MAFDWDDVVALAPSLSAISAEAQALILAHVALQVGPVKWGALQDAGSIYLAAHLGTLALNAAGGSTQAVGPVVSQTVGPVSRAFAVLTTTAGGGSFDSTSYGQEYARLRALLPTRFGLLA